MKNYAVWITHDEAMIYRLHENGCDQVRVLPTEHVDHHTRNFNDRLDKGYDTFYHKITEFLTDATGLLVLGPGTAKVEFCHHCEDHHHAGLAKTIKGVETISSHPTAGEILKVADEYFV